MQKRSIDAEWRAGGWAHEESYRQLHQSVCGWVGRSNVALAQLLAHLGEIDALRDTRRGEARQLHLAKACPTLTAYCVYVLRMSEDAAHRRAKAAEDFGREPMDAWKRPDPDP